MEIYSKTDVGIARRVNEDFCLVWRDPQNPSRGFLCVADGMGGHNAGDTASAVTVTIIDDFLREAVFAPWNEKLVVPHMVRAVSRANEVVYRLSTEKAELKGMGTTLVFALIDDKQAWVANVGDSRAYVIRGKKIEQITKDHSMVQEYIDNGTITKKEAMFHPQKNMITRAVGSEHEVEADIYKVILKNQDIILLCSDGLTNMIDERLIAEIISAEQDITIAADKLVEQANLRGGHDNITVTMAKISE